MISDKGIQDALDYRATRPMHDDAWFTDRQKLGRYNQAGIISLCPVCDNGVSVACDDRAQFINDDWFHGPCSRFAKFVHVVKNV